MDLYQYPPAPRIIHNPDGSTIVVNCPAPTLRGSSRIVGTLIRWIVWLSADGRGEGFARAYVRDTPRNYASVPRLLSSASIQRPTTSGVKWDSSRLTGSTWASITGRRTHPAVHRGSSTRRRRRSRSPNRRPRTYLQTATLTLNWSVSDDESGIRGDAVTATLDGMTAVGGHGLASGQAIDLLTEVECRVPTRSRSRRLTTPATPFPDRSLSPIAVTATSIQDEVNLLARGRERLH